MKIQGRRRSNDAKNIKESHTSKRDFLVIRRFHDKEKKKEQKFETTKVEHIH